MRGGERIVPKWFDTAGLAEFLGIRESVVRRWRREGVGPKATKVGGRWRFFSEDVEAFLIGRATRPWRIPQ